MINRLLPGAVFAGCAAGFVSALLHFAFVEKYILLAEEYETGARVHFAGVETGHDHTDADAVATAEPAAEDGHDHQHEPAAGDESPMRRHGLTVVFSVLLYAGYGLIAAAAMALAGLRGHVPDVRAGVLWGLAGFASVQLAPALGLAPELPGTLAAGLAARQGWWVLCVASTAAGLATLAFGRGWPFWLVGLALMALPHLIGAPEIEGFHGVVPPEVASAFAARSLAAGLGAWLVLGGVLARLLGGARPS